MCKDKDASSVKYTPTSATLSSPSHTARAYPNNSLVPSQSQAYYSATPGGYPPPSQPPLFPPAPSQGGNAFQQQPSMMCYDVNNNNPNLAQQQYQQGSYLYNPVPPPAYTNTNNSAPPVPCTYGYPAAPVAAAPAPAPASPLPNNNSNEVQPAAAVVQPVKAAATTSKTTSAQMAAATATLVEASLGTLASGVAGVTSVLQANQTHNAMMRIQSVADGTPELRQDAERLLGVLRTSAKADNIDVTSGFAAASALFGSLRLAVPSPFSAAFGVMSVACGLAVRVRANRSAVCNLAERIVSLNPIVLEVYRKPDPMTQKIIDRLVTVCNMACDLMHKFAPDEEEEDVSNKKEKWFGASFVSWAQKKFNEVAYSPEDFDLIHQQLDRVLHDYNFGALVKLTTVPSAPNQEALRAMTAKDQEDLKKEVHAMIRDAMANSTAEVKDEIAKMQQSICDTFGEKLDKMGTQLDAIYSLLMTNEYKKLEIDESRVRLLGDADASDVVEAELDDSPVVAKQSTAETDAEARDVLNEAALLTQLYHPNIIRCFGVVYKHQRPFVLVERCATSLSHVIRRNGAVPQLIAGVMLLKIGAALRALHSSERVLCHVTARSIRFKDASEDLCLADVGSATSASHMFAGKENDLGQTMKADRDSLSLSAPEMIRSELQLSSSSNKSSSSRRTVPSFTPTKKCDVYCFGLLAHQLLSGSLDPFTYAAPSSVALLSDYELSMQIANDKLRPVLPEDCPSALSDLIQRCWKDNPDDRPTMEEVYTTVAAYVKNTNADWSSLWKTYLASVGIHSGPADAGLTDAAASAATGGVAASSPTARKVVMPNVAAYFSRRVAPKRSATPQEAASLLNAMGLSEVKVSEVKMFCRTTCGQQETVTVPVFCLFFASRLKEVYDDKTAKADPVGTLSPEALVALLKEIGLGEFSLKEAERLMKLADVNGDHMLEYDEFVTLVDTLLEDKLQQQQQQQVVSSASAVFDASVRTPLSGTVSSNASSTTTATEDVTCSACGITTSIPFSRLVWRGDEYFDEEDVCGNCLLNSTSFLPSSCIPLLTARSNQPAFRSDTFVSIESLTTAWEYPISKHNFTSLMLGDSSSLSTKMTDLQRSVIERVRSLVVLNATDTLPHLLLGASRNLKRLFLPNGLITDDGIDLIASIMGISTLDLSGCGKLTDVGIEKLKPMEKTLMSLSLARCVQVTDAGVKHLTTFSRLRSLCLDGLETISDAALQKVSLLTELRRLSLAHCDRITDDGVRNFITLEKLERLSMTGCERVSDASIQEVLCHVATLTSLQLGGQLKLSDASLQSLRSSTSTRIRSLSLADCSMIRGLSLSTTLQSLDLSFCRQVADSTLAVIGTQLKELSALRIAFCVNVSDDGIRQLASLPKLRLLDCQGLSELTDTALTMLAASCTDLQSFSVSENAHITDVSITTLLKSLASIRTLATVRCGRVSGSGLQALSGNGLTSLTLLDVNGCVHVTDDSFRCLVAGSRSLRTLNVSRCNNVTDATMAAVTMVLPGLEVFDGSFCDDIGDGALASIVRHCPMLRRLNVARSSVTDVGIQNIGDLHSLEYLDLSYCSLSDTALTHISALGLSLQILNVSSCNISDQGIKTAAARLSCLRSLSLQYCDRVTDHAVESIASGMTVLQSLKLSFCNLSDAALFHVSRLALLEELDVEGCRMISDMGVLHLRGLKLIKTLNLSQLPMVITDRSVPELRSHLPRLKMLSVAGCGGSRVAQVCGI